MPTGVPLTYMISIIVIGVLIVWIDISLVITLGDLNNRWKRITERGSIR